jgi:hypothetical protein
MTKPKTKAPAEKTAPHKLHGQLVLQRFDSKRQLVDQRAVEAVLLRPDFDKAEKIWQKLAKGEGRGFIASMFVGHVFAAKVDESHEAVSQPLTLFQAQFSQVTSLAECAIVEAQGVVPAPSPAGRHLELRVDADEGRETPDV